MKKPKYYMILGVSESANSAQIKMAYHRLAIKYHPDMNNGDESFIEKFKEINEAYQLLSDPEKRKKYDAQLNARDHIPFVKEFPDVYYLKFTASKSFVKQFEEIVLEFRFPSEGRFFKRQSLDDWYLVEGPKIQHVDVVIDGIARKETRIKYILAAINKGNIVFEGPSVVINSKRVNANPLYFTVQTQQCYVNPLEIAVGKPLILEMEKQEIIPTKNFIKNITRKRLVLLPLGENYQSQLKRARLVALFSAMAIAAITFYFLNVLALSILLLWMCYFACMIALEKFKWHTSVHLLIERHPVYRHLVAGGYTLSKRNLRLFTSHGLYRMLMRK